MGENHQKDKIGYKSPPRNMQFKKGQSGNPKGRPKGARNFATVIDKELGTKIEVTENGKRRRISKREAIVKQTVNKAASGDPKATAALFAEARFNESQNQLPISQSLVVGPEDQMVMDNILRRIWLSQTFGKGSAAEPPGEDHQPPIIQSNEGES
jgi:Family of unknown function (DUF5681)